MSVAMKRPEEASGANIQGERAPLLASGAPAPWPRRFAAWLASLRWRLVLRVALVFVVCCLASGTLAGFPAIQPLLMDVGLFNGSCPKPSAPTPTHTNTVVMTNVSSPTPASTPSPPVCQSQNTQVSSLYTISMGVSAGSVFFLGVLYDRFGPLAAAVIGAAGNSLSFVILFLSVKFHSLDFLAYIGFPLADIMGNYNSFALYGFLWHFPGWNAVIIGMASASYAVSGINGEVFAVLVQGDWQLTNVFLLYAGISGASAVLCYFIMPSQKEYYDEVEKVFGVRIEGGKTPIVSIVINVYKYFKLYLLENTIFCAWAIMGYVILTFWVAQMDPYNQSILGKANSTTLGDLFSIVFAILGCIASIFLGTLMDILGLKKFNLLMQVSIMVYVGTLFIPTMWAQIICIFAGVLFYSSWAPLLVKWSVIYCSPSTTGSFFTSYQSVAGIIQLIFNLVVPMVMPSIAAGAWLFIWPFALFGGIVVVLSVAFTIMLLRAKLPETPPILADELKE